MIRLVQFEHFLLVLVSTAVFGALASYADTERIPGDGSADPFRLLFVGNSIFFTNGGVNHVRHSFTLLNSGDICFYFCEHCIMASFA